MDLLLTRVLRRIGSCPPSAIAIHCHDTGGRALNNISVALDNHQIRAVDTSIAGLGGCPFAGPNAPGNVATESVVQLLTKKGYSFTHKINLADLVQTGQWIRDQIAQLKQIPQDQSASKRC